MMRYLTFESKEAADQRASAEALARGCGPVTARWWASEADEATGAAVLLIPDDEAGALTDDERGRLTGEPDWLAERRLAASVPAALAAGAKPAR